MVLAIMLGGLFGLIFLGLPLGFTICFVSAGVLHFLAEMPLWMFLQRFYAGLDSFVLVAIPFFLLTGNIMNQGNITEQLIKFAHAIVGHIRGGLSLVMVVACMLFGGVSGSAVADVAGVGSVMIPSMIKKGYSAQFAVALTSTASTLGQIIPPSIIMIVYASTAGTSVGALFLAGVVPGLLIGLGLMVVGYFYALKNNLASEPRQSLKNMARATIEAALTLVAPLIIIGGVVTGVFTATESSVVAALYCGFIALFVFKTITWKQIPQLLLETAKMSALTLFCIGGASMFGWLMGYFEVTKLVTDLLASFSSNIFVYMVVVIALFTVLGSFMDAVPAIIIFVPVVAPIAESLGIHPVHLGLVVCVVLAFGLVTPPYGLCLLLGSSIAKIPAHETFKDLAVCLSVVTVIILLISFVPDSILFLPKIFMPKFM